MHLLMGFSLPALLAALALGAVFMFSMANVPNTIANLISAAGLTTPAKFNHITAAGAVAILIAAPTADGQEISFMDEGGHAHTIAISPVTSPVTTGFNAGANHILTFGGTAGDSCQLVSRNGSWITNVLNGVTPT